MLASGRFRLPSCHPPFRRILGWIRLNASPQSTLSRHARCERSRTQRGAGHLKLFIVLAVFAAIGYVGFKVVPPYVNNYQLQDTCESESHLFAAHQKTDQRTREAVWAEVQSLGIPITQDAIKVEVIGRTASVSVDYTIVVNLFGYELNLPFHAKGESPMF